VGEFASAGFKDEFSEIVGFGRLQFFFRESVEPRGAIGEEVFPTPDEEVFFVEVARFGWVLREGPGETFVGYLFAGPGETEVDGGDAEDVKKDNSEVGKFKRHDGERSVEGAAFPGGFHAFLFVEESFEEEGLVEEKGDGEEEGGEEVKVAGEAEAVEGEETVGEGAGEGGFERGEVEEGEKGEGDGEDHAAGEPERGGEEGAFRRLGRSGEETFFPAVGELGKAVREHAHFDSAFAEVEVDGDVVVFEEAGELKVLEDLVFDGFVATGLVVVVAGDEEGLSEEGRLLGRGGGKGINSGESDGVEVG